MIDINTIVNATKLKVNWLSNWSPGTIVLNNLKGTVKTPAVNNWRLIPLIGDPNRFLTSLKVRQAPPSLFMHGVPKVFDFTMTIQSVRLLLSFVIYNIFFSGSWGLHKIWSWYMCSAGEVISRLILLTWLLNNLSLTFFYWLLHYLEKITDDFILGPKKCPCYLFQNSSHHWYILKTVWWSDKDELFVSFNLLP